MSHDEAMVGHLVKSRERCRQLGQLYRSAYGDFERRGVVRLPMNKVCSAAAQLVTHLRAYSGAPVAPVQSPALRKDAEQILMETSDLLHGVLVIERELREAVAAQASGQRSVSA